MPKKLSLAEEIARLSNPQPEFNDPEEFGDNETAAKVIDEFSDDEINVPVQVSSLRRRTAALLSDHDKKYAGRTVSRKSLHKDDDDDDDDDDDEDNNDDDDDHEIKEEESEENDSDMDDDKYTDSDDIIEDDAKITDVEGSKQKFKFDGDFSRFADDDFDEEDQSGDESEENDNSDSIETEDETDMDDDINDVKSISKTDITEEVAKGKAAKDQLLLWDSLLEGRIRLQKALVSINQLPQHDTHQQFMTAGGQEYRDANKKARKELKTLLTKLLELQQELLLQNPETAHVVGGNKKQTETQNNDSNEEITSDESGDEEQERKPQTSQVNRKRKLDITDYDEFISKRHKDFQKYQNNTIQKWNDKTKLVSGKFNSKAFSSFDRSAITQIKHILSDKERLVKRTQLKRSVYKVLGKPETVEEENEKEEANEEEVLPTTDSHLKNYDEEIFDDDDFYHQLLRELIEKRTMGSSDPIAMGRQWLQIQRLRSKIKKHVDTRASKGRKIRYDVHQKMISFMAPVDRSNMADESRTELFHSLFGKKSSSVEEDLR